MKSGRNLLIDTNVLIGLEDWKEIAPEFARLQQLSSKYQHHLFVHDAAISDIRRDVDSARRRVTLSKVEKFERLSGVTPVGADELVARFGKISKPNDEVDVALLHALFVGAVDFLVTQDQGIHSRARRLSPAFADRVLTVADAVNWLVADYEPKQVQLPLVEEVLAHQIDTTDEIFASLRDGYPGFDRWWRDKCVAMHRPCWKVSLGDELAGLVVHKQETHAEAKTKNLGPKILKICTFKVKPKFRGEKLGELLLKQVIWYAQINSYDVIYLTTFPEQEVLIRVIEYFGFERSGLNDNSELVFEKTLARQRLVPVEGDSLLEAARKNYPRFVATSPAKSFCVPIRGDYHDVLFPELADRAQADLFEAQSIAVGRPRTPGNTIRKVYLCRSSTNQIEPGSVIYFYRSASATSKISQSITTVGVVERVTEVSDLEHLVRLTAKRSVFTGRQLQAMVNQSSRPIKAIDFLLIGHLSPAYGLADLKRDGVFVGHPPQSICALPDDRTVPLRNRVDFGFEV